MVDNGLRFRLNTKHLFLTYPRCAVPKETAFEFLSAKLRPVRLLVAAEIHADGTPHLHAYCGFDSRRDFRNGDFADIVDGVTVYHGNYQACRSPNAVTKYTSKDGDFVANFDVSVKVTLADRKRRVAKEIVLGKRILADIVKDDPDFLFGYARLQQDINAFRRDEQSRRVQQLPPFLPNPWAKVLPVYNNRKKRHYWIYSDQPNLGKTHHFAKPLAEEYGGVIQSNDFTYWNVCFGLKLLILDEYNSALLKFAQLNSICDGTFGFRLFQGGVVRLDGLTLIILSNTSLSTLYPFMHHLLLARFIEIKLD